MNDFWNCFVFVKAKLNIRGLSYQQWSSQTFLFVYFNTYLLYWLHMHDVRTNKKWMLIVFDVLKVTSKKVMVLFYFHTFSQLLKGANDHLDDNYVLEWINWQLTLTTLGLNNQLNELYVGWRAQTGTTITFKIMYPPSTD